MFYMYIFNFLAGWTLPSYIVYQKLLFFKDFSGPSLNLCKYVCECIMETWSNICPKFVKVLFHLSLCESLHQRECLKKKKVFRTEETNCPLKVPANHMRKRETWVFEIGRPTKSSRQKRLQISLLFLHTTHLIDDEHKLNIGDAHQFNKEVNLKLF